MKSFTAFVSIVALSVGMTPALAMAQEIDQRAFTLNRHQLYVANELQHYRLFEQTTHPRVLNAGTFTIGGGGTADEDNWAVELPTRQFVPMELAAGVDHLIIAVCDEDCLMLNLRVYDANGNLVGEDTRDPPTDTRFITAEVQLMPPEEQTYRLETEIACRAGSRGGCSYAIGLNAK
jgi:hypothetical protein